jgi:hypothetical protein
MKIEYLIQKIEDLVNASSTNFEFKVYDSLKMDNEKMDINKINGIARVTGGGFEPIASLGQGSVTISVEFIYPYERLEAVNETLQNVAQSTAGLVVQNSSLGADLQGTTGIAITYPIQGNYYNGTMGETAKSRLICYFDINEKAVLANDVKIQFVSVYEDYAETFDDMTQGEYYVKEGDNYKKVILPNDYKRDTEYYLPEYSVAIDTEYGIYEYDGENYTTINFPQDYKVGKTYYWRNMGQNKYYEITPGTYYTRSEYQVEGKYIYTKVTIPYDLQERTVYYSQSGYYNAGTINVSANGLYFIKDNKGYYKAVNLPKDWVKGQEYYSSTLVNIPYYKQVITRHRISTTNKYENNTEMQTVNDGQSIDISLAVPSISGSIMNQIKDDLLMGRNIDKPYTFRFVDESEAKIFENMIASGDFSYEVVPGDTVIFKILFVYKRK